MMRPVILSSPENTAREFSIFCVGISVITVSSGGSEVSAGCGGLAPGGPICGIIARFDAAGGADVAPGGGGKGCASMFDGEGPPEGLMTDGGGKAWAGYCTGGGGKDCGGYCVGDGED